MSNLTIYIAGPMTGIPEYNFSAFDEAEKDLIESGWVTNSPAQWCRQQGFNEKGLTGLEAPDELINFNLRKAMAAHASYICNVANAMFMLRGWERSNGARAEHALAVCLGLEVMYQ